MKKHISLLMVALMVAGCISERMEEEGAVTPLTFSASVSSSDEELMTKGELVNTTSSVSGLGGLVNSMKISAWTVKSPTDEQFIPANTEVTFSSSKWSASQVYYWQEESTKVFYAYANLPGGEAASVANGTSSGQTLSYEVPDSAADQEDILLGYYKGKGDEDGNKGVASLMFYHPLASVSFKLGATYSGLTEIKSIRIEGVYSEGSTTQTGAGTSFIWTSTGSKTVSQSMSGTLPDEGGALGESFLLIPQDLSEQSVSIVASVTVDGVDADIKTELSSGEWKAGYNTVYTMGYDFVESTYSFNVASELAFSNASSESSKSLVVTSKSTKSGVSAALGWKIKSYSVSGITYPVGGDSFTDCGLYARKSSDGTKIVVTSNPRPVLKRDVHSYWIGENGEWSPEDWSQGKAASAHPIDLSRFDFRNETTGNLMNTANCYIIRHSGTYRLPLVYGNAIKDSQINTKSFCRNSVYENNLQIFLNHLDQEITSPFIEENEGITVTGCQIVWQDMGAVLTGLHLTDPEVVSIGSENHNVRYLEFTVDPSTVCQNNALIAVTDASGAVWSWHIWITNNPALLAPDITVTNRTSHTNDFMALPCLGYIDPKEYLGLPDVEITLVQDVSGNEKTFTVSQPGAYSHAEGTFYQFGRKDPMCRVDSPAEGSFVIDSDNEKETIGYSIKYPGTFICKSSSDWCSTYYLNLWTGIPLEGENMWVESDRVEKTVYDPSPAGYVLPCNNAFTNFAKDGSNHYEDTVRDKWNSTSTNLNVEYGLHFYTDNSKTATIFFPGAGHRTGSGALAANGLVGEFWSAVTHNEERGSNFYFYRNGLMPVSNDFRASGRSARPVHER